jgi:hypothetical protein
MISSLPQLQQRAAAADCSASDNIELRHHERTDSKGHVVLLEQPRMRRPRWTPNVHYVETTEVDIVVSDEDLGPH